MEICNWKQFGLNMMNDQDLSDSLAKVLRNVITLDFQIKIKCSIKNWMGCVAS